MNRLIKKSREKFVALLRIFERHFGYRKSTGQDCLGWEKNVQLRLITFVIAEVWGIGPGRPMCKFHAPLGPENEC